MGKKIEGNQLCNTVLISQTANLIEKHLRWEVGNILDPRNPETECEVTALPGMRWEAAIWQKRWPALRKRSKDGLLKLFIDTLAKAGIVRVDPLGAPFDPQFHQAVSMIESRDVEPGRHRPGHLSRSAVQGQCVCTHSCRGYK